MPDWADFVPELVCLGVDLVIAGVLCKCYENANKVVRDLNSATQLTVDSGLKDGIRSHPEAMVDEANDTVTVPYVALRGVVTPLGKSVISLHPQQTMEGVIQRVVFTRAVQSCLLTQTANCPCYLSRAFKKAISLANLLQLKP